MIGPHWPSLERKERELSPSRSLLNVILPPATGPMSFQRPLSASLSSPSIFSLSLCHALSLSNPHSLSLTFLEYGLLLSKSSSDQMVARAVSSNSEGTDQPRLRSVATKMRWWWLLSVHIEAADSRW